MPGHNSSLVVMFLWLGWYGVNPGSQLALIGYSNAVANAAVTTTIAPAIASLSALLCKGAWGKFKTGDHPSTPHTSREVTWSHLRCLSACSTVSCMRRHAPHRKVLPSSQPVWLLLSWRHILRTHSLYIPHACSLPTSCLLALSDVNDRTLEL